MPFLSWCTWHLHLCPFRAGAFGIYALSELVHLTFIPLQSGWTLHLCPFRAGAFDIYALSELVHLTLITLLCWCTWPIAELVHMTNCRTGALDQLQSWCTWYLYHCRASAIFLPLQSWGTWHYATKELAYFKFMTLKCWCTWHLYHCRVDALGICSIAELLHLSFLPLQSWCTWHFSHCRVVALTFCCTCRLCHCRYVVLAVYGIADMLYLPSMALQICCTCRPWHIAVSSPRCLYIDRLIIYNYLWSTDIWSNHPRTCFYFLPYSSVRAELEGWYPWVQWLRIFCTAAATAPSCHIHGFMTATMSCRRPTSYWGYLYVPSIEWQE